LAEFSYVPNFLEVFLSFFFFFCIFSFFFGKGGQQQAWRKSSIRVAFNVWDKVLSAVEEMRL
jgi:hypothetical protein